MPPIHILIFCKRISGEAFKASAAVLGSENGSKQRKCAAFVVCPGCVRRKRMQMRISETRDETCIPCRWVEVCATLRDTPTPPNSSGSFPLPPPPCMGTSEVATFLAVSRKSRRHPGCACFCDFYLFARVYPKRMLAESHLELCVFSWHRKKNETTRKVLAIERPTMLAREKKAKRGEM